MEEDFPKLEQLLKGEPIRKTTRLENLKNGILNYKNNRSLGKRIIFNIYRLKYGKYPDENIMKDLERIFIPPLLPYLNQKQPSLFG